MTLRQYLFLMLLGTLIAATTVFLLLRGVNPEQSGIFAPAALLLSVGLVISGLCTVLGLVVRTRFGTSQRLMSQQVRIAFRQSIFVAGIVVLGLSLSHLRLFAWWNILLAVCALGIAEYFFLSSDVEHAEAEDALLDPTR
jgi:hypothetical protein